VPATVGSYQSEKVWGTLALVRGTDPCRDILIRALLGRFLYEHKKSTLESQDAYEIPAIRGVTFCAVEEIASL
jgi:hypothetical protein